MMPPGCSGAPTTIPNLGANGAKRAKCSPRIAPRPARRRFRRLLKPTPPKLSKVKAARLWEDTCDSSRTAACFQRWHLSISLWKKLAGWTAILPLRCGATWQPDHVERVIETFDTSTRVAKVATDAGTGFLKGMGNPAGNIALASELVAGELAACIGLRVPEFAVVNVTDLDIPMQGHGPVHRGPAFISRTIDGFPSDGTDAFVSRLDRPGDIAKLVLFDSWTRNADRYPPIDAWGEPNRDNLFFTAIARRFGIVALDHSHAFVEGDLETEIGLQAVREDARVYGLFPEFCPYVAEGDVLAAAHQIGHIDAALVREIVGSIPMAWGPSAGARLAWVDTILARAAVVSQSLPDLLLQQMRLDLGRGGY